MAYLLTGTIAYLVGSFPTGVVLSRSRYGLDVRAMGSGNIGATNVTRVFGWSAGMLVFLIDFFKGFFVVGIVHKIFASDPWLVAVAGTSVVVGHCFSAYLGFRGGKGVSTSLGCLLAAAPGAFLAFGLTYVGVLAVGRISALGSLAGMLASLLYLVFARPEWPVRALVVSLSLVILIRHRSNIERLFSRRTRP